MHVLSLEKLFYTAVVPCTGSGPRPTEEMVPHWTSYYGACPATPTQSFDQNSHTVQTVTRRPIYVQQATIFMDFKKKIG